METFPAQGELPQRQLCANLFISIKKRRTRRESVHFQGVQARTFLEATSQEYDQVPGTYRKLSCARGTFLEATLQTSELDLRIYRKLSCARGTFLEATLQRNLRFLGCYSKTFLRPTFLRTGGG